MKQAQLDSAVARATGESLRTIQRQGFCLLAPPPRRRVRPPRAAYPLEPQTSGARHTAARSA